MSCNACLRKYGFLCKETGCPNCGFSFCTKCLKKTIEVPKLNGAERRVCLACFDKISQGNGQPPKSPGAPPDFVSPLDDPIPDDIQANLDEIIQKRLNALKNPVEEGNSDEAIAIRVANLKDIPYNPNDNLDLIRQTDTRTDEEKTADLIKQFMGEVTIDNAVGESDPIKDIEARLAALKKDDPTRSNIKPSETQGSDSENEDESTKIQKLTKRYLDEAQLPDCPDPNLTEEEQEFIKSVAEKSDKENGEELPWCHICNEDATIRCLDCSGDLFCKGCFKEFHVDEEDRNHQRESYKTPAKSIATD